MKSSYLIICFFMLSAHARANSASPRDVNPEISGIFTNEKSIDSKILTLNEISPYEIQAAFSYGQGKFKQSGDGQEYDTESAPGNGIILDVVKKNNENYFRMNGAFNRATFKEPTNIGGKEITVNREQVSLKVGKTYNEFSAEIGAGAIIQNASTFSSNEKLLPEYYSLGPSATVGWTKNISQIWTFGSSLSILVPVVFKENSAKSGSHKYGGYGSVSSFFKAKLNRRLSFNIGASIESEQHVFSGEGDRKVADASISYLSIMIPVGVSYVF